MTAEDTEIPQLQEHAKKLTEASRISTCRRFLNELLQLLNSMSLWAFNNGIMYTLPGGDKQMEEGHLRLLLRTLKKVRNPTASSSSPSAPPPPPNPNLTVLFNKTTPSGLQ